MADKEWTVMFFFAGDDNVLSPLVVAQLKAIKDAGFHQDVDVLVHFDSNEAGVPTRVFNVNRRRKEDAVKRGIRAVVGDGRDSFVRNMADDNVDPKGINGKDESASANLRAALEHPDTSTAGDALNNFLGFCRENHRAKNYILFVVGHGQVVGNDAFLPDDNPVSAITLEDFRAILQGFTDGIKTDKSDESPNGGVLQLLALHSCSMSAIEVAYQLKGTARYMIGSEGVAFVESWPHRQLLKRIFNFVGGPKARPQSGRERHEEDAEVEEPEANDSHAKDPRQLIRKLYFHTLFNAADFMISGYSLDLGLCNLDLEQKYFDHLSEKIGALVVSLKHALESERGRELILLAHLESQSYWGESYTDFFDFCFCLRKRCRLALGLPDEYRDEAKPEEKGTELGELARACFDVMTLLDRERSDDGDLAKEFSKLVVHSCHFGPKYQYSHGLSVYFPWSRPIEDDPEANAFARTRTSQGGREDKRRIMERYRDYLFNKEVEKVAGGESWFSFLEAYFNKTQRMERVKEDSKRVEENFQRVSDEAEPIVLSAPVSLPGGQSDNPFSALQKESGRVGGGCTCPSIKNYMNAITISKILARGSRK